MKVTTTVIKGPFIKDVRKEGRGFGGNADDRKILRIFHKIQYKS